jgi:hypothetical protein
MTILFGLFLVYGIPALLTVPLWLLVRRLAHVWEGRDVMERFRPSARAVNHSEALLRVRNHPN